MSLQKFIDESLKFVEDLDLSQTEVDELVRRAINQLFSKALISKQSQKISVWLVMFTPLPATFPQMVHDSTLDLPQLTQFAVNMTCLEVSFFGLL
jgi:hypothetical protein